MKIESRIKRRDHGAVSRRQPLLFCVSDDAQDPDLIRNLNLYVVNSFYQKPYDPQMDFYSQFYQRLEKGRELLKLADD